MIIIGAEFLKKSGYFLEWQNIFSKYNLDIYDVEELPTHGGSLRIYGSHASLNKKITNNVKNILLQEEEFGIKEISTYTSFQKKIEIVASDFVRYIKDAKNKNLRIAGSIFLRAYFLSFFLLDFGTVATTWS